MRNAQQVMRKHWLFMPHFTNYSLRITHYVLLHLT